MPQDARVPGGVAILRIAAEDAPSAPPPRVSFQGTRVLVVPKTDGWYAVVGLPLALRPGAYEVEVSGAAGLERRFTVADKAYPEQRLTIKDKRKVTPPPEDLERIERERQAVEEIKQRFRDEPGVDLDFRAPADAQLSSRFGLRRVFNGEPRNPHSGLDLAVAAGSQVYAAAAGVVAATGDYFFNGHTVFVDHGQGLITMYCHLGRIDVRPGEAVAKGQRLGLSGMSGRATGPHLHWSVILNRNAVDPELFLAGGRPQ
jgi:murein DD-endopeptidase MepM/ murein hydrolase activator NlpD